MKKVLLLMVVAIMTLSACNKQNPIVGSWVKSESKEAFKGANVGMVNVITFNSDGTVENKNELQAGVKQHDFSQVFTIYGKWEMPSDDKLILNMEKAVINGEEMENKKDIEYTIVKLDDDNLELMTGGKVDKYSRKK